MARRPLGSRGQDTCPALPCTVPGVGFDQYHEPADELPPETRTFARLCASLTEEAEAIGWDQQRLPPEPDAEARPIMAGPRGAERNGLYFGPALLPFPPPPGAGRA